MTDWDWSAEDRARLAGFLEHHRLTRGDVTTRRIGDGHSNLTYLVSDADGRRVVVRRPPPPPTPPGAHDMLREAHLLRALADTPVPVADVLATADGGEILDVPLYVMTFVAGEIVTTETPPGLADPTVRRRIGVTLVDTLAALHTVDWQAAGLADMGKPVGFNRRHLRRMGALVADENGDPPAAFAPVAGWLDARVPTESGAAIVHNDYRLGNVMLSTRRPGEIDAVLDWELATIGDPLLDLGYFLASVPEASTRTSGEPIPRTPAPSTPTQEMGTAMLEDGYPTRTELAERYRERTGADLTHLGWYVTLALWKLAVLYEYGRRRAVEGVGDSYFDQASVHAFLDAAARSIDSAPEQS